MSKGLNFIQIAVSPETADRHEVIYALRNDGTIWKMTPKLDSVCWYPVGSTPQEQISDWSKKHD